MLDCEIEKQLWCHGCVCPCTHTAPAITPPLGVVATPVLLAILELEIHVAPARCKRATL